MLNRRKKKRYRRRGGGGGGGGRGTIRKTELGKYSAIETKYYRLGCPYKIWLEKFQMGRERMPTAKG